MRWLFGVHENYNELGPLAHNPAPRFTLGPSRVHHRIVVLGSIRNR